MRKALCRDRYGYGVSRLIGLGRRLAVGLAVAAAIAVFAGGMPVQAGDVAEWLEQASDPQRSPHEREYAAEQLIVLADSSASTLVSTLRDPQAEGLKRRIAARLLGRINPVGAESALLETAFSDDPLLAEVAADALGHIYAGLSDPDLFTIFRLGNRDSSVQPDLAVGDAAAASGEDDWMTLAFRHEQYATRLRSFAMRGLAQKYSFATAPIPEPLVNWICLGLLSPDPQFRLYSLRAASVSGSDEANGKLAAFLYAETEPRLLIEALQALAKLRPPDYGDAVERHVGHANPLVGLEALATLHALGYPGVLVSSNPQVRTIASFVRHPSTPVRLRAVELLGQSMNPAAVEPLMAALFDRVGNNRAAAAEALGNMGFTAAIGGLSPLLRDGRPEVRAAAALALHRLGVVGVAAGVLDNLASDSVPFQRAAAQTLGLIGDRRAAPPLVHLLSHDDVELACLAAQALGRIGDISAGPQLFSAMRDAANPAVRDMLRQALFAIYRDDPGDSQFSWDSWARRNNMQ